MGLPVDPTSLNEADNNFVSSRNTPVAGLGPLDPKIGGLLAAIEAYGASTDTNKAVKIKELENQLLELHNLIYGKDRKEEPSPATIALYHEAVEKYSRIVLYGDERNYPKARSLLMNLLHHHLYSIGATELEPSDNLFGFSNKKFEQEIQNMPPEALLGNILASHKENHDLTLQTASIIRVLLNASANTPGQEPQMNKSAGELYFNLAAVADGLYTHLESALEGSKRAEAIKLHDHLLYDTTHRAYLSDPNSRDPNHVLELLEKFYQPLTQRLETHSENDLGVHVSNMQSRIHNIHAVEIQKAIQYGPNASPEKYKELQSAMFDHMKQAYDSSSSLPDVNLATIIHNLILMILTHTNEDQLDEIPQLQERLTEITDRMANSGKGNPDFAKYYELIARLNHKNAENAKDKSIKEEYIKKAQEATEDGFDVVQKFSAFSDMNATKENLDSLKKELNF